MKVYIFLLLITYNITLAAQQTQPSALCKTSDTSIVTTVNTNTKNDGNMVNTVNQSVKNNKTVQQSGATQIIPLTQLKIADTLSKHGNLLLSNTTSESVRKALSKMGYNLSFMSHTTVGSQSMPFTSVGNIVLSEVNFY